MKSEVVGLIIALVGRGFSVQFRPAWLNTDAFHIRISKEIGKTVYTTDHTIFGIKEMKAPAEGVVADSLDLLEQRWEDYARIKSRSIEVECI